MAASPVARHWRIVALIVAVVGGLWAWIVVEGYDPVLGLDLQGGVSVVLCPVSEETDECASADESAMNQAVEIIRNRVDALGVAEPDISRQGENILVQIPGVEDQERALQLIGTTAALRFRPVLEALRPPEPGSTLPEGVPACGDVETYPRDDPKKEVVLCLRNELAPPEQWGLLRLGPAAVEGTDVKGATATLVPGSPAWTVSLDLTSEGATKFAEITGKLACNRGSPPTDQLAIALDRVVETAPSVGEGVQCNVGIPGGQAEITGDFDEKEAKDLALILRYGALPVELRPSATTTVSPTLGRESLRGGLLAGLIGVAIVFLYVLFFYRRLGLIIWLGIGVHGALTLAVVILLGQSAGFALSLAGVAGLVVSLGIAADSFIVYFERIKDEILEGRTARAAVDRAWASARRTIVAADLVTALAAAVLYFLAVGSVRGFALMLGLATALDVFVSFWFMHPMVWLLANTRLLGKDKSLGFGKARTESLATEGGRA